MSFLDDFSSFIEGFNSSILYALIAGVVLIGFGIYATIRMKGMQITRLGEACRVAFTKIKEKKGKQTISSFQAFCVSMGARIGVGNIAGVACAIVMGGPGAIFWMWIFAIIGAATSFVENTIGQIYKEKKADGHFHGGPAYYVKNALKKPKFAVFMAVMVILTYGLGFLGTQINQAAAQICNVAGVSSSLFGADGGLNIGIIVIAVILMAITGLIIFGGIRRVAKVSTWLVPAMAIAWMLLCCLIILLNFSQILLVIETIFNYAFNVQPFLGGGFGMMVIWGLKRGMFSNEAGNGSIPNVSSSAKVKHPVKQGLIQSVGVLIDTLVVCSATAFVVILYTNTAYPNYDFAAQGIDTALNGVPLVSEALSNSFLGVAGPIVLAVFLCVFAYSSVIGYYSMSETNLKFISEKKIPLLILRIVILVYVFFSCIWSMSVAWNLADTLMLILAISNIIVLIPLAKNAFAALKDYFNQKDKGIEEPVFDPKCLPSQEGITCWPDKDDEEVVIGSLEAAYDGRKTLNK